MPFFDLAIVGLLVLLNGFFAMSELAVVSSRRARLQHMAAQGHRGAVRALRLVDDPTSFLSTVQVGITLVGIFAGAYSGSTLAGPLADVIRAIPGIGTAADNIAFAVVVVSITYLSLIAGELVPKRIALNNAEGIAIFVAPFLEGLARVGSPIVWFLRISTEGMLRILRVRPKPESTVTEEEVKSMIAEGTASGVFDPAETAMINSVLRIADLTVRSIMVPRPDVVWLDVDDPAETVLKEIRASSHSRYPVSKGTIDEVVGIIHTKDLLLQQHDSADFDMAAALREPTYVHSSMGILDLLERFKSSPVHMVIVLDEHGTIEGIATPTDILIAIAGDIADAAEAEPDAVQRQDGSWLLSGRTPIHQVEELFALPDMREGSNFTTIAGFVLHHLGHIPEIAESFEWRGWRFEVLDLDGRRVDKILASRIERQA